MKSIPKCLVANALLAASLFGGHVALAQESVFTLNFDFETVTVNEDDGIANLSFTCSPSIVERGTTTGNVRTVNLTSSSPADLTVPTEFSATCDGSTPNTVAATIISDTDSDDETVRVTAAIDGEDKDSVDVTIIDNDIAATNIPTLSEWAMILMTGLLLLWGVVSIRRNS